MPGWHKATKKLREKGAFQTIGIIQEQHPDRCRLFMQWKKLEFPVLVDSFNMLGVKVVPMTIAIDEYGIVRHVGIRPGDLEKEFLSKTYSAPGKAPRHKPQTAATLRKRADEKNTSQAWMQYADALVLENGAKELDAAISAYQSAIALDRSNGAAYFRVGVAYRMKYDRYNGAVEDFRSAVEHWGKALDLDPNQYIWRRRIQQYGPRLDKPYPFYDWVRTARHDIIARGEKPATLRIEPRGAELAQPAKRFTTSSQGVAEPDPRNQIDRDRSMVLIESAVVPAEVKPGGVLRLHMTFRVNRGEDVHWNNESGPMEIWIRPLAGWKADPQLVRPKLAGAAQTTEERHAELELQVAASADPGVVLVPGYALYFVCRGKDGVCLYRRQDFIVPVTVR